MFAISIVCAGHALLGLRDGTEVRSHPRFGASWEGFALEHVLNLFGAQREVFFWATHGGAELDLLVPRGGKRYGFEFKFADAPATTKSMRMALSDLELERLFVVFPGDRPYALDENIDAVPLVQLETQLAGL